MRMIELADRLGEPLAVVVAALYTLVHSYPDRFPLTIVNPGADDNDLDVAERRIGRHLHPLHRTILRQSNGGIMPCVISQGFLAGAVLREPEWRWIIPPAASTSRTFDEDAGLGPFAPQIIGEASPTASTPGGSTALAWTRS